MSAVRTERNGDGDQLSAIVRLMTIFLYLCGCLLASPRSVGLFLASLWIGHLFIWRFWFPPLCTGRKV